MEHAGSQSRIRLPRTLRSILNVIRTRSDTLTGRHVRMSQAALMDSALNNSVADVVHISLVTGGRNSVAGINVYAQVSCTLSRYQLQRVACIMRTCRKFIFTTVHLLKPVSMRVTPTSTRRSTWARIVAQTPSMKAALSNRIY